jgi:hypothetical protein
MANSVVESFELSFAGDRWRWVGIHLDTYHIALGMH